VTAELLPSKDRVVGAHAVRRALPLRQRRTIGAWCFADHLGPLSAEENSGLGIGPHPHTGLATVTWLVEGELLHRDSLGTEQPISPGQLNLMHAGEGIAHAEEHVAGAGGAQRPMHGIQLWVAQPEVTRHGAPGFEHHAELPRVEQAGGVATVLLGSLLDAASPARTDTPLLGAELLLSGPSSWPLPPAYEVGVVVLSGAVAVDDIVATPGHLAFLGTGRDELVLDALEPTRLLLLGGEPFEAPLVMWWNYVGRSKAEMLAAHEAWEAGPDSDDGGRFGTVASRLPRIPSPRPV
jgi:redox-sensitive bicupin YhaK (pirin superfamily)